MRCVPSQRHSTVTVIPCFGRPLGEPIAPDGRLGSNGQVGGTKWLRQFLGPEQPVLPDGFGSFGSGTVFVRPRQAEHPLPCLGLRWIGNVVDCFCRVSLAATTGRLEGQDVVLLTCHEGTWSFWMVGDKVEVVDVSDLARYVGR